MSKNKCVLIVWLVHAPNNAFVLFAKVSIVITVAHYQVMDLNKFPGMKYCVFNPVLALLTINKTSNWGYC